MARRASTRARSGGPGSRDLAAEALDAALDIAEERGWAAVRLHDVADRLGVTPNDIFAHYRDLDAVADAWFRRALDAMIAPKGDGFTALPAQERIETCLLAWFDALAPHRRVTAEMLQGKLHLPHPHHWVPMVFNLSRTIQWLREAAYLPAPYGTRRAQLEEIGLTLIFLATLRVWTRDRTENQDRTRHFLRRRLGRADRFMTMVWGRTRRRDDADDADGATDNGPGNA